MVASLGQGGGGAGRPGSPRDGGWESPLPGAGGIAFPVPVRAEAERAHIVRVLDSVSWNKKQAASVLEISRGTLYRKIVEYGLEGDTRPSRNKTRRAAT